MELASLEQLHRGFGIFECVTVEAIGIDIGGTGIKGALVNVSTGSLLTDRVKLPTPAGGSPMDIVVTVQRVLDAVEDATVRPLGICFPAIVKAGRTMSAANVSPEWIDFDAEAFFERELGRPIHFINDADAAGVAEVQFGVAKGRTGLTILTTLGTGIGSAFIYNGTLLPNTELGHIEFRGQAAEKLCAYSALVRDELSWEDWAERLSGFYTYIDRLFSPDVIVLGGGVAKHSDKFMHLIDSPVQIVPATHLNNAGILGAAWLASRD